MKIEINDPLNLLLEIIYIIGSLGGKEMPSTTNLNNLIDELRKEILGDKKQ